MTLTKDRFVSILKGAGFSQEQMRDLHRVFEREAPNEHQGFLEYLHIGQEEIKAIRQHSREA